MKAITWMLWNVVCLRKTTFGKGNSKRPNEDTVSVVGDTYIKSEEGRSQLEDEISYLFTICNTKIKMTSQKLH